MRQIGQGTYGTAYKVKFQGNDIVIKEAMLYGIDQERARDHISYYNIGANISKLAYPGEYKYLAMVRNLIKMDANPNFVFAYDIGFCDSCLVFDYQKQSHVIGECYTTFMELADGDLNDVRLNNEDLVYSIIFQLLLALQSMETTYGILHGDIKRNNILIKRVKPGGYFKYTIENSLLKETFYVKNMGIIPMITDFGMSRSYHPKYSDDGYYYGLRSGKIEKDFSFTTLNNSNEKSFIIEWNNGISTYNRVDRNTDLSGFTPPLDPSDIATFPPFEFFYEIMDVLHIFNGGPSMSHVDYIAHAIPTGMPRSILDKINSLDDELDTTINAKGFKSMSLPLNTNIVSKFISPVLMLKELYNDYYYADQPPSDYKVIASFLST